MGAGAFTRPQATTTMSGSTLSMSSGSVPPQIARLDRGKAIVTQVETAIVTQAETEPTPIHRVYNHLNDARKRRLAESLLVLFPAAFEGDDPTTAEEYAPTLKRIEIMLNKAMRFGYYFGVKPWQSFPPPLTPAVEFDYGLNPRSILFPMFTPSETIERGTETYDNILLLWYGLNAQGVKTTFSPYRIIKINEVKSEDPFLLMVTNFRIKVTRSDSKEYMFTLADLPFMNPADLVSLITLCSKRKDLQQMSWLIEYFSEFLEYLFKDYAHQDVELGNRLKYEVKKPRDEYIDRDRRANGEIIKDGDRLMGIYFETVGENGVKERRIFRVEDIGLYESTMVTNVTAFVQSCPKKAKAKTNKFVLDRLTWIIDWRTRMFELSNLYFPQVYDEANLIEEEERERLKGASGSGTANEEGFIYRGD